MEKRNGSRSIQYNLRPHLESNTTRWNETLLLCYALVSDEASSEIILTQHNFDKTLNS